MKLSISPEENKIWFIIFGVWLIYFCFGFTVSSIAPLVPYITDDLNITYKEMGLILGAWQFIYIFTALPAGLFVDKYGLKISIFLSAIIIAISLFSRGLSDNFYNMWIAVALFGIGGPLISVSAPKASTLWANQKNRAISMGILITGPFFGGITSLSITNSILMPLLNFNWKNVFYTYSFIPVISAFIWLLIFNFYGINNHQGKKSQNKFNTINTFKLLIYKKRYILILILGIIFMFLVHGISGWMPKILISKGLNIKYASFLASVPIVIGIISALTIPRFCNNTNRLKILFILFANVIIALNLLKFTNEYFFVFGLVLLGISTGSLLTLLINHLAETEDISFNNMGVAGGLFYSIIEIGGVLGPFSIGLIYDYTQNFNTALSFYIIMITCSFLPLYILKNLR